MFIFRIFAQHRLIVIRIRGESPVAECLETMDEMRKAPTYSPEFDVITDVSALERHYTPEDIRFMAEKTTNLPAKKVAIIAPQDLAFGMSRMWELLTEHANQVSVRVFRDWSSALAWLGRDAAILPELQDDEARGERS